MNSGIYIENSFVRNDMIEAAGKLCEDLICYYFLTVRMELQIE